MDSTDDAWERRNRLVRALSSRSKPKSRCSVSMYGEPNWLASYRAKKITRLAFSVYRSNMLPSPQETLQLTSTGKPLSLPPGTNHHASRKKPFCPARLSIIKASCQTKPTTSAVTDKNQRPSPPPNCEASRGRFPLHVPDADAAPGRSARRNQGCG